MPSLLAAVLCAAALGLWARPAAANSGRVRIPVDWTDAACMTIVDRTVETNLHLTYTVRQDDIGPLTPEEVEDGRTHQFFGLCRARLPTSMLPRWITQADIDRALAVGAAPKDIDPADVFETSHEWVDCWSRITPDDARIPITMAAAARGVDWDTSTVPAGVYVVDGYTWDPALNVWSEHPGVVKIVDDPDLAASGPALAISTPEAVVHAHDLVTIEGCASAMDGSTVTAYWSLVEPVAWVPFIVDDPVIGDSFAVELEPPEALIGESAMIRVDITDPMGRHYTNYMRELVIVLGASGCTDDGGGFIGEDPCGGSGTSSGTSGGPASSSGAQASGPMDTSSGPSAHDDASGCGCRAPIQDGPAGTGLLVLGLLGLLGSRRRLARSTST